MPKKDKDVKTKNSKLEDVKPEDVKPEDIKPEDVKPEGIKPEDVKPEGIKPEDVKADSGFEVIKPVFFDVLLMSHHPQESYGRCGYPLKQYALSVVQDVIALGREVESAKIAQDENNYNQGHKVVLSGKEKFTNLDTNPLSA